MSEKYCKLAEYLAGHREHFTRLTIGEIEDIIESKCPRSAYDITRNYWYSEYILPVLRDVGWETDLVDHAQSIVTFRRIESGNDRIESPLETNVKPWLEELQELLGELGDVGNVKEVVVSKTLRDAVNFRFTVAPRFERTNRIKTLKRGQYISTIRSDECDDTIQPDCTDPVHRAEPNEWLSIQDTTEAHSRFEESARNFVSDIVDDRGLGGYGCLATMSRHKSEQTGRVAVYSPAALGLVHVRNLGHSDDSQSLHGLVSRGQLELVEIEGHDYDKPDSIRIRINNPGRSSRFVRIHAGTVFEQVNAPSVQNLAVKDLIEIEIQTGYRDVRAHGMCMDESSTPPHGQPMLLTPWILVINTEDLADQQSLWRVTGSRD